MYNINFLINAISELQTEALQAYSDITRLEILERRENLIQCLLIELGGSGE